MEGIEKTPKAPAIEIPEEVLQGGMRNVLRFIHDERELRPIPLRRHVPSVENGRTREELSQLSENDATAVEVNAIAGHLISGIWPKMHEWIENNPGRLMSKPDVESGSMDVVPEESLESRFRINPEAGFRDLRHHSLEMCQKFVETDIRERIQKGDAATMRLRSLLTNPLYAGSKGDPAMFVSSGFVTANDAIWGLLNSIPSAYRRFSGQPMNPEKYAELAASAKQLALALSSTQINVFGSVRKELEGDSYHVYLSRLAIKGLHVVEDKGSLRVDIEPDVLRVIARNALNPENKGSVNVRTGCPALFVSGAEGSNVISDYFDWCYSLAEKYYVPTLTE